MDKSQSKVWQSCNERCIGINSQITFKTKKRKQTYMIFSFAYHQKRFVVENIKKTKYIFNFNRITPRILKKNIFSILIE